MAGEVDRIFAGLAQLIEGALARTDHHALYPCTVVSQNADLTLELRPDSPTVPALSQVPIRLGIPGATAAVATGARVLLGFENGDARRPIATLWGTGDLVELRINGGTIPIAKEGSSVTGQAGPYPAHSTVDVGAGYAGVKVP